MNILTEQNNLIEQLLGKKTYGIDLKWAIIILRTLNNCKKELVIHEW